MDMDEARSLSLQTMALQEIRRIPDVELGAEREYYARMRAWADVEPAVYGDSMIPPECWRGLYDERLAWIDAELRMRKRIAGLYRPADMGFSAEYVDEVKRRIHLAEFIALRCPSTRLRLYGGERKYLGYCPWHADDSPSLGVWEDPEWHWYCFSCLEGGDVFSWLLKSDARGFRDAVEQAAVCAGLPLPVRGGGAF